MSTDSYGLTSKFWLLPDGQALNVSTTEHALAARARMLQIPDEQVGRRIPIQNVFEPLSRMEAVCALADGCDPDAVSFLMGDRKHVDPRVYAISRWDWIRTRKNLYFAREWGRSQLARLLDSREYWAAQPLTTDESYLILRDLCGAEISGTRQSLRTLLEYMV